MNLNKAIVVIFCVMVIVMPIFTPLLHLENIGLKFLKLGNFSSESSIFGWVKLYYFAMIIVSLWIISLVMPGEKRISISRADIAIAAFLLMGLIMLLAVPNRFDSCRRITELIGGFSLYFIAKNVFQEEKHRKALLISFAVSIGIISVLGIIHYFVSVNEESEDEISQESVGVHIEDVLYYWLHVDRASIYAVNQNTESAYNELNVAREQWRPYANMQDLPMYTFHAKFPIFEVNRRIAANLSKKSKPDDIKEWTRRFYGASEWGEYDALDLQYQNAFVTMMSANADKFDPRYLPVNNFILPILSGRSSPWEPSFGIRATSTIGNPNFLADILIFIIPLWVAGTIFIKKGKSVNFMAFLAIVTFGMLLVTNSWGGYAGVILSVAAMIGLFYRKKLRVKYKVALLVAVIICFVATVVFFGIKGSMAFGKGQTGEDELVGAQSRVLLWDSAWDMIKRRPLTGWGLGNFFTYSNMFISKFSTDPYYEAMWVARPEFLLRNPGRVHNEFLSLIVELGFPGLILFLLIFVLFLYEVLKGWKPGNNLMQDIFIFGVTGGIIAIWAQSMLSFPFRLPISMMTMCTIMGAAIVGKGWKNLEFNGPSFKKAWIIAAIPVVLITSALFYRNTVTAVCLWKFKTAADRYKGIRGKMQNYPDEKVIEKIQFCVDHWHREHDAYFRLPLYLLFHNRLDEAEKALKRLEYVQPYHEKTHFYWGEYWRKRGDAEANKTTENKEELSKRYFEKAIESYKNAVKYEARYIIPQILMAETYIKMGKLEEAQKVIDTALKYEPEAKTRLEKKQKEAKKLAETKRELKELPWEEDIPRMKRDYQNFLDGRVREKVAEKSKEKALSILRIIGEKFSERFLAVDGFHSREINNRIGILLMQIRPPKLQEAITYFQKSRESGRNIDELAVANYNIRLAEMILAGDMRYQRIPLLDVSAEKIILMEQHFADQNLKMNKFQEAEKQYIALLQKYPLYAPTMIRLAQFYDQTGRIHNAKNIVRQGLEFYPGHPQLKELARKYGIE